MINAVINNFYLLYKKYSTFFFIRICALIYIKTLRFFYRYIYYLKLKKNMDVDKSFDELCLEIASEDGVDEHGMHKTHLEILKAIKDLPVAKNRLASVVDKKIDELENYIMPVLLSSTKDQGNLVRVTNKGYAITTDGLLELKKRGISYEHRSDT